VALVQFFSAMSVDGFIAGPDHELDWLTQYESEDGETADFSSYERFLDGVGALAMGARTYEFILAEASAWPYGDRPTWIFTHGEHPPIDGADLRWASAPPGEVIDEVRTAAGERNVWLVGGGQLAAQFLEEGLLDELILSVVPIFLEQGIPLLPRRTESPMRLTGTDVQDSGIVELHYEIRR